MKLNFFLFFSVLSLLCSISRAQTFCNGVYCNANCTNCYPCNQEVNCFKAKGCFCASKTIPGNLPWANTPQFVFFTLDDSIRSLDYVNCMQNLSFILNNPNITDSMGCNPKLSAYVMGYLTDYNIVNYLSQIGTVSLHTHTHTTNISTPAATWATEMNTILYNYNQLAKVSYIKGSRAPYLQANDAYLAQIQSMPGILYDSSFVYGWNFATPDQANNYWPFTLDFGVPDSLMCTYFASCPTQPHPGLWEFPLIAFNNSANIQDYNNTNYTQIMSELQQSFNQSYYYNKAPRGFYSHWRYLTNDGDFDFLNLPRAQIMIDFFTWMVQTYPDIIFTTEDRVISWMLNPTTTSVTKTLSAFQCVPTGINPAQSCQEGASLECDFNAADFVTVCSKKCPQPFPDLGVQWTYRPTNYNYNNWPGSINYTVDDSWPSGFCGSLYLTHKNTVPAVSWILSANVLNNVGSFTAFWGFVQMPNSRDPDAGIYRQIGFNQNVIANVTTYIGGWCMATTTTQTFNTSWVASNVKFGIDLYSFNIDCPLENCALFCGNGRCDANNGENSSNCPYDCGKLLCPRRRLFWNRWF